MIAAAEWSSMAFDAEYKRPAVTGEHGAASTTERGERHTRRRESFHQWPRAPLASTWTAGHVTGSLIDADGFVHFEDSSTIFAPRLQAQTNIFAYTARIKALRTAAAQDGYELSSESERDFWKFVFAGPQIRRGLLVLMDNGNLRATWKDETGARLGLQFLGGQMVQYVIFKRRETTLPISRVAGRDTFAGLKRQIDAFELHPLLCE